MKTRYGGIINASTHIRAEDLITWAITREKICIAAIPLRDISVLIRKGDTYTFEGSAQMEIKFGRSKVLDTLVDIMGWTTGPAKFYINSEGMVFFADCEEQINSKTLTTDSMGVPSGAYAANHIHSGNLQNTDTVRFALNMLSNNETVFCFAPNQGKTIRSLFSSMKDILLAVLVWEYAGAILYEDYMPDFWLSVAHRAPKIFELYNKAQFSDPEKKQVERIVDYVKHTNQSVPGISDYPWYIPEGF